ncbi:hypothetical protein L1887_38371 [Cichorium endivia]|nr:hypothetical protein L1887_38371 [Cichorium endivia]
MKPSFIFSLLLLSIILYQAKGIRFEKSTVSSSNNPELITKTSLSIQDDGSAMATELLPGTIIKKRRLSSHGHWLPKIHEDYYGPRHHTPRHH